MRRRRIVVLKFGSSVLRTPADIPRVGHEIYRWVRAGWKVIAVVSAFAGETDALLGEAAQYESASSEAGRALLAATGELRSAAHLTLGLDQSGLGAELFDAAAIGLDTIGTPLDAEPVRLAVGRIRAALRRHPVLVVPGFIGRDSRRRVTLLGRGGSDCTAIFLAQQLGARCRLVKDVDGLYEWDPQTAANRPRRFRSLPWEGALQLDGSIVQHKAIAAAEAQQLTFEVGSIFARSATRVGRVPLRFASSPTDRPQLRVGVLGAGTVGRGVLHRLQNLPEWFEVVGVAVRRPERHRDLDPRWLTGSVESLLQRDFDLLIDASGATTQAFAACQECLVAGRSVITADKRLVSSAGAQLEWLASRHGAEFRFAAAVGGALPAFETVQRIARRQPLVKIEAVLNGTTNFVLERMRTGEHPVAALAAARTAGLAEHDASRDLDGLDAADKLVVLARAVLGRWLPSTDITTETWEEAETRFAAAREGNEVWRQVASLEFAGPRTRAAVRYQRVPRSSPLAHCPSNWNVLSATTSDGRRTVVRGKGAGRWPTAESLIADAVEFATVNRKAPPPPTPVVPWQPVPLREEIT